MPDYDEALRREAVHPVNALVEVAPLRIPQVWYSAHGHLHCQNNILRALLVAALLEQHPLDQLRANPIGDLLDYVLECFCALGRFERAEDKASTAEFSVLSEPINVRPSCENHPRFAKIQNTH